MATRPGDTSRRAPARRRILLTWVAVGLLVAAGTVLAPAAASAAAGQVVAPDSVMAVADPGVTLDVPADGRLHGYHFAGQVLGAATGSSVPTRHLRAAAGQKLWVFGLRWRADLVLTDPAQPDGGFSVTPVSAALIFSGQRVNVPLASPAAPTSTGSAAPAPAADSGPQYFVASVPAAAPDVEVEMSSHGFAQHFSLTHMTREGAQPAALYRNPGSWDTVNQVGAERDIPTPFADESNSLPSAALVVKLAQVTLSYFGPEGTAEPAPGPDQAWLIPHLTDPPQDPAQLSDYLDYRANVTAAT